MSVSESTEDREKAYQKQYQSDRLLRRRFSYEALEKKHRVTVKGKDLSAELMAARAPGVTGETPWVKDLTVHPLQWRREGIPAGLPRHIPNAFGDLAPGRDFTDPRMLFDASLFESMTDEEIAYFNDQKHWAVENPSAGDDIVLDAELKNEPGCYGYLVHLNRGRKELNNPPVGRPHYKRADGKELVWGDPRLEAPYWQECGDFIYAHLDEASARAHFDSLRSALYSLNQELRLYRLTKPISIGEAREWLNSDHPLREDRHGAITVEAVGTGQLDTPGALRVPQLPAPDEDELNEAAEKAWWDSLTADEQRAYEAAQEADVRLVEDRAAINLQRQEFYDRIYKDLYNVDALLQQLLEWAEEAENEADAQWHRENNTTMDLEDKLEFVASFYRRNPDDGEAALRAANLVTPHETLTHLAGTLPLTDEMIAAAAARHRNALQAGTEQQHLNFRRRTGGGEYVLTKAQEQYAREHLITAYTRSGTEGSAQLLMAIYEPSGMTLLDPHDECDGNGFCWETMNLDDYRAGFLFPLYSDMPTGGFAPAKDRVEYLCLLLKQGVITLEQFWQRLRTDSYIGDRDEYFENGSNALVMTKKNWRNLLHQEQPEDTAEDPVMMPTDWAFVDASDERLGFWTLSEWEAYVASQPEDWFIVGEDVPMIIGQSVEPELLLPEMLAWHQRHLDSRKP